MVLNQEEKGHLAVLTVAQNSRSSATHYYIDYSIFFFLGRLSYEIIKHATSAFNIVQHRSTSFNIFQLVPCTDYDGPGEDEAEAVGCGTCGPFSWCLGLMELRSFDVPDRSKFPIFKLLQTTV